MRQRIGMRDTVKDIVMRMSEGNPGAINVMMSVITNHPEDGFMTLLGLDDMNIWGTQIWIGYKDYCGEDLEKFIECVRTRDKGMVAKINEIGSRGNHTEIAVCHGASYNR